MPLFSVCLFLFRVVVVFNFLGINFGQKEETTLVLLQMDFIIHVLLNAQISMQFTSLN